MGDQLHILMGEVKYLHHFVEEDAIKTIKPIEVNHFIRVSVRLTHKKEDAHYIDFEVEQGFDRKTDKVKILTVISSTKYKVIPYDNQFFKKPATTSLVKMITSMAHRACDMNRGMFVVIREDYGLNEALPMAIEDSKMKDLIYNDINTNLLN